MAPIKPASPPGITLLDRVRLGFDFCKLPYFLATGLFRDANKGRSWKRTVHDSLFRFLTSRTWGIYTFQSLFGTTGATYRKWACHNALEILSDDIGEGAQLHWIGPRRYDRVLLYFHGGGFSLALSDATNLPFIHSLQRELEKSAGGAGVVLLEYSLTPDAPFPTQLKQAIAAVTHLFNKGLKPEHLLLSGDSAGGNLVLQLFSHYLHPTPVAPPPPTLTAPFGGAVLISPWISFDSSISSFAENDKKDVLGTYFYSFLAAQVTAGVQDTHRKYVEAYVAPDAWWDGLDGLVRRVFVSAGELECPRDPIVKFCDGPLRAHVPDTVLVVEQNGVHEDMIMSFGAGEGAQSAEYWKLVKWLSESFSAAQ
ncbi:alpha/beta-hydrolase [Artomyces pyxidatus]|uniref:Alpha/beta-hydrolase n=1 Tax=Artomyces pyxidatus TaxID=48021 RepID=A0ACB8SWL8_9AGAM|nr:alpha/beta-hydrolase [Artomyces pyxidatus]